mgnify:CR=1 FL=1
MASDKQTAQNIDAYIARFPPEVQERLAAIRAVVRDVAPEAREAIKYGLPTFVLHGNLVHFGAFKHHIGFYPTPSGLEQFKDELTQFKSSTGAVQFPLDQPLPLDLIRRITAFRVQENTSKGARKGKA